MDKRNTSNFGSPPSVPSVALTSPSSLGSNSILSDFSSDSVPENHNGLWSGPHPLEHANDITVASDNSLASVGISYEQSNKFDLNGDDTNDFYDELRSQSGLRKAVRSMSLDSACPTHLSITPRKLVDLFTMFNDMEEEEEHNRVSRNSAYVDMRKIDKDGTDSDAATEITSNTFTPASVSLVYHPKIESLQRECETLKQIINTDSTKLLQLQGERKILMESLDRCAAEKKQLQRQIRGLQLEREVSLQHQKSQDEMIRLLRAELENASGDKTSAGASSSEIEQLKLANELLASQVIQAEHELKRANSDRNSDKENTPPPPPPPPTPSTPVAHLKRDWGVSSPCLPVEEEREVLSDITPQRLAMQLQQLESRLKDLEDVAHLQKTKEDLPHVEKAVQCKAECIEESNEEDTVEAALSTTLEGPAIVGIEVGRDGTLSVAVVDKKYGQILQEQICSEVAEVSKRDYFCGCLPHKNCEVDTNDTRA